MANKKEKVNDPIFRAKLFARAELMRDENDVIKRTFFYGELTKMLWRLIFYAHDLEKQVEDLKVINSKLL